MHYYLKWFIFMMCSLFLTACSHTPPDQTRFVQYSQTLPPVFVPPGIKNPTGLSYYPVPPVAVNGMLGVKPPLNPPGAQLTVYKKVILPAP
jgi:uncharacterized lipoprotein